MVTDQVRLREQLERFRSDFEKLRAEVAKVVVGQNAIVEATLEEHCEGNVWYACVWGKMLSLVVLYVASGGKKYATYLFLRK